MARQDEGNSRFNNRYEENQLENLIEQPDVGDSNRLADFYRTRFRQRRLLRRQQEQRVEETESQFADSLELADRQISRIQLDDRGREIGFVPNEEGKRTLAGRFADEREFVEPADVTVDANPRTGVLTRTDPNDLDTIAARAQTDFAGDDPYTEPDDLRVEVGPGGVESVAFTDTGQRRRAGREIADTTALETVGPSDLEQTEGGFSLTTPANRRLAARNIEADTDQFGRGELNPDTDIRAIDGGFGLTEGPARELAADNIDEQIPELEIGPSDIELEETESGSYRGIFEGEVRR